MSLSLYLITGTSVFITALAIGVARVTDEADGLEELLMGLLLAVATALLVGYLWPISVTVLVFWWVARRTKDWR